MILCQYYAETVCVRVAELCSLPDSEPLYMNCSHFLVLCQPSVVEHEFAATWASSLTRRFRSVPPFTVPPLTFQSRLLSIPIIHSANCTPWSLLVFSFVLLFHLSSYSLTRPIDSALLPFRIHLVFFRISYLAITTSAF